MDQPGTPDGDMMRRYRHLIALSPEQAADVPLLLRAPGKTW